MGQEERDKKGSILIVCYTEITRDPRVMKQITHLTPSYKVTVIGLNERGAVLEDVVLRCIGGFGKTFLGNVAKLLKMLTRVEGFSLILDAELRKAFKDSSNTVFDAVIVNDASPIPTTMRYFGQLPVIFDAHEYYPEVSGQKNWKSRIIQRYHYQVLKRYLPQMTCITTVSEGIRRKYRGEFNVESELLLNTRPYFEIEPKKVDFKNIRLIHHGVANPSRNIGDMIKMMDYIEERFSLDLMLVNSDNDEYEKLKHMAEDRGNVNIIDPVPMVDIIPKLSKDYDIGVFILRPLSINQKFALPNKLFEFIQAKLAIAIGPSPEMRRLVEEEKNGIVSDSFIPESLANELNKLTKEDLVSFKKRSVAISEKYSDEQYAADLNRIIETITG